MRDPESDLEDDFFDTVLRVLDITALDSVKKLIDTEAGELAGLHDETAARILERHGIDVRERERTRQAAFEAHCVKSFGPRMNTAGPAMTTRRIRLEYVRPPRGHSESASGQTAAPEM